MEVWNHSNLRGAIRGQFEQRRYASLLAGAKRAFRCGRYGKTFAVANTYPTAGDGILAKLHVETSL